MNDGKTERKVIQGGFWGAFTIIFVWLFESAVRYWLPEYQMPTEVAQAFSVVFSTGGAYWTQ